ncbi:sigma 54-interacting transcriptional regulator [Alkaliphilus peptidifermentans]|uniref:HTH-type transcriptional regulatory protein TyrR n=1 Tax=Alkaliphilus peptidifermentans DSM 18978 TaxID=1120976 RepID=A0A1G5L0Q8_9FIRM|nr:sigma 54-interacting transcriptional regulator [Alkaliphilus peptidifermentans]SCZ06396.1 PAS domain S-box-containing protein [Alkaliphilus peptidifermentans DSM 18978]
MQDIINISMNKCKQCFSCVRNCPADAVEIKQGQASIIHSRCISCGKCVKSCPQKAKIVVDYKIQTLDLLESCQKVIACLAPSFIASFYPHSYKRVVGALKNIGFHQVWEVAVGAEVLSKQLDVFLESNRENTYLTTTCPAFVSLIEKHYPELIQHLTSFVSPMIATGRLIREEFINQNIKIVFIGPCIAKKAEALDPQFKDIIDIVLTFEEIKEILIEKDISLERVVDADFDQCASNKGRLFALSIGFENNLKLCKELKKNQFESIHSEQDCLRMIDILSKDKIDIRLIDVLMCKGCIEGPKMDSELNYYKKINVINSYFEENKLTKEIEINDQIDLSRSFRNRRNILPLPSEEEIKNILEITYKYSQEDELNCGACGYSTCRNKAVAVFQGIAEIDMCLPYLLFKKEKLNNELSEKLKETSMLKDELETIIESSYDGIVVTDGLGKILKCNNSWLRMIGCEEACSDKIVQDMENNEIIFPSATLLTLKEKRRISFIQNIIRNKRGLATGTPIFDDDGSIKRVITNVRDIDELNKLRTQIEETMRLEKYRENSINKIEKYEFHGENIIANSLEMGKVLQLASSVSTVDTTVLILGESGVGKEVVAKFIHKLSKRNNQHLISINCGAIPENLIESELFGYETGAFTGAQKKGKPGLIEITHKGTLFLDEVGELPLNLQVKLLRVIQEKKLIRLGGISETEVDVRIIAATNKDLYKMVQEGKFRPDLYYRLNVIPIEIPPLRKRKGDIIPLCHHFIEKYNQKYGCNKEVTVHVEKILKEYNWLGNVRELENVIERLSVTTKGDIIDEKDLPLYLLEGNYEMKNKINIEGIIPIKEALETIERKLLERAYEKYSNTYEMAEALGVNQSTVVRKIQKYIKNNALKHD